MRELPRIRYWKTATLIAILFSSRWPAYHFWKNFPPSGYVRDVFAFRTLDCESIHAANQHTLSKLTHCPKLRLFVPRGDCSQAEAEWARQLTFAGSPGIPGETIRDADTFIIDRFAPCEVELEKRLLSQKHEKIWESPSGVFAQYRMKPKSP